jgi:hypothetical protein
MGRQIDTVQETSFLILCAFLTPIPRTSISMLSSGRTDTFYRSELNQQPSRQCRTDARQPLQHVDFPRGKAFRLSVVPLPNHGFGSGELFGKKPQDMKRVFRPASVDHRELPHDGQRNDCTLQRVRMDFGHLRRLWTFEQHDRPMRRSEQARPPEERVGRRRETSRSRRTSFVRRDAPINEVVADG